MKNRIYMYLLILMTPFFMVICPVANSATNTNPTEYVSLNKYYTAVPENSDGSLPEYYSFTVDVDKMRGYIAQFRAFVPPGAVLLDLSIMESGRQKVVARHMFPPTGSPINPPDGSVQGSYFKLNELIAHDCWVIENTTYDILYIASDGFTPTLELGRAGWLYVKVGGGTYSEIYDNHFSVRVKSQVYNEWWNTYIKDEAGWNKYVEGVMTYVDPTQAKLSVTPTSQNVVKNAGTTTFDVTISGTGTMQWKAAVTQGSEWLSIISGATGTDKGTITCSYTAASIPRTGIIRITADGATNSPVDVSVVQEGMATTMPIPSTGQTICYDADGNPISPCPVVGQQFYGQDANYQINPMSYTKLDSSGLDLATDAASWAMVRDNVTGLIWNIDASKRGDRTTANKIIESLNTNKYGGYSDWRLPTVKELSGLVTYRIPYINPVINEVYFPNTKSSTYWSSTPYATDSTYTWGVDFNIGMADAYSVESNCYVRSVRGDASEAINYTDQGNGTVTDKNTALMWQQDGTASSNLTWEKALNYCETLVLGGYTDWRMPNVKELMSLADYSQTDDPAINKGFFDKTKSVFYWASTTTNHEDFASHAWGVDFYNGSPIFEYIKEVSNPVRAVRDVSMLSVSPSNMDVTKDEGTATFNVYISGSKSLTWKAETVGTIDWLTIDPKPTGNAGSISCTYSANNKSETRAATIRITAAGAELNSQMDVTVTQEPVCIATLNDYLVLNIPNLYYAQQQISFRADFQMVRVPSDPYSTYFQLTNNIDVLTSPSPTCAKSTLSNDLKIHIPDVLMNGIHYTMDLEYKPNISYTGAFFIVTNREPIK